MTDIFIKTFNADKAEFHKQQKIGKVIKLITLGLLNNDRNIQKARSKLVESQKLLKRKEQLFSIATKYDHFEETIKISGVRISKYSFADLSVLGTDTYPENWYQLRQEILERDNYQCQLADGYCNGPLQIHHKIELSKGGSNNSSNLITLCKYHHYKQHAHLNGRF